MIRETTLAAAGYAIAELASLLLVPGVAPDGSDPAIRDLDEPFDYAAERGVAEVSLCPLNHLDERIGRSLAELRGELSPCHASQGPCSGPLLVTARGPIIAAQALGRPPSASPTH